MELDCTPRPDWLSDQVWPYPLHDFDAHGHRVVYTDTGRGGPVLLLVHVGLWSLLWRDLIGQLAGRYRCVTLDVPGSGLSPGSPASLSGAVDAIGALLDHLDLHDATLVVHDTGGVAALAALAVAPGRIGRIVGLVALNTFAWQPRGALKLALRVFGSTVMREVNAWLGLLAWASATLFGVGRRWDAATKRAWRRGLRDRDRRRFLHRMFAQVACDPSVSLAAERAAAALADRPTLTVFGQLGDYFFFRRRWRSLRPDMAEATVPWGIHFPMSDNPALVARALDAWHQEKVATSLPRGGRA